MDEDWQAFPRREQLAGPGELLLERARAIGDAVARHPDFTLVRCSRLRAGTTFEVLVVDVECDAVPPKNPFGINFRERLALIVPPEKEKLVEVLALRPGFPRLMHQNAGLPDWPPSLCLYFGPQRAIMRTWTPENFLGRIQFWLQKSARGELHPADQPVEQLFFVAQHELVLPWNLDALQQQNPSPVFDIQPGPSRDKNARTFFLRVRPQEPGADSVDLLELNLDPVVHGRVEADPATLGGLADLLLTRSVDMLAELKRALSNRVGGEGVPKERDAPATLVLLHMPVIRAPGQPVESISRRGYLIRCGALALGSATGRLFEHRGKYFKEQESGLLAQTEQKADWRNLDIDSIEVLRGVDRPSARQQSGVKDDGPRATLVGAGALGATMLDLWTRCGWGEWTAVDKDHVKPHNVVRHPADQRHLGRPKEQVARLRAHEIMNGAAVVQAVHADACDLVEGKPLECIRSAEVVVDVSTTLDYPRMASAWEGVGRHASVFVTPKGNAGILLMEDDGRSQRLRTLEAQYYRAVMEGDWGSDHLDGNYGTYWSGAGCRDISFVMPYSGIVAHAAVLSEQVRAAVALPEAQIKVWTRTADGAMAVHGVPVHSERRMRLGDMALFIDEGIIAKMRRLRAEHLPRETGGVLLGYHDLNIGAIVVVDAMEAPPDSESTEASFERGVQGVADAAKEAHRRTAGIVGYIGEWHSHPPGYSADPSRDDLYQLAYLAIGLSHDGMPAVTVIIGEDGDLQALMATVRS
jgi:integrative and conjugative element protein (TIGR02256 family)